MEDLIYQIGPHSFYQTNTLQALELYKVAREFAQFTGEEIVYDLYTGCGTIALFISHQSKKVIGVDYVNEAIEDAKTNAQLNKINNVVFYAADLSNANENLITG